MTVVVNGDCVERPSQFNASHKCILEFRTAMFSVNDNALKSYFASRNHYSKTLELRQEALAYRKMSLA